MKIFHRASILLFVIFSFISTLEAKSNQLRIVDFGQWGTNSSADLYDLNNIGQIVGTLPPDGQKSFLWRDGMFELLPFQVTSVSENGYIAGNRLVGGILSGVILVPGTCTPFGAEVLIGATQGPNASGTEIKGRIHDDGVCGDITGIGTEYAFRWMPRVSGNITTLVVTLERINVPGFDAVLTFANDCNRFGIIGGYFGDYSGRDRAMSVSGTNAMILADLTNQAPSQVLAINDSGDCVGYEGSDAILWRAGNRISLISGAKAVAINNQGQIILAGHINLITGQPDGPLIWSKGAIFRLQELIGTNSDWQVFDTDHEKLNDNGWFIGGAHDTNSNLHSILIVLGPAVTAPPANTTAIRGSPITMSVSAFGLPEIHYQWMRFGTNLADSDRVTGSLTSTLTISPVTVADAGTYAVVVTNAYGSITSSIASLTVALPPIVIERSGDILNLSWASFDAVLQQAGDPRGPWMTVTNAVSPFAVNTSDEKRFFRLRAN
jgi:hypothetical protein